MAEIVALVAAFFFALAATLQQKGALGLGEVSFSSPASFLRLAKQTWWLLGHRRPARRLRLPGRRAGQRTPRGDPAAPRHDHRVRPPARLPADASGDTQERGRGRRRRRARPRGLHRRGRRGRRGRQRACERVGDRRGRVLARRRGGVRPRRAGRRLAQGRALRRLRGRAVRPVRVPLQADDGDPGGRRPRGGR